MVVTKPLRHFRVLLVQHAQSSRSARSNQDVADLASSFFIKNMQEILTIEEKAKATTSCSHCQDPASNYCASCRMFMCQKCSASHDIWPANKNHDALSVEQLRDPESQAKIRRKLYCLKHEDKILEYYCETCKELCCIDCVVLNHSKQNHSCLAMRKITPKQ